jgi:PAS domain S-box-containing protein
MLKQIKILVLEDVLDDAILAEREIKKTIENPEFKVVDNEKDFLSALEQFNPDIIISDYSLPSFDGLSALKLTKDQAIETPFIIFTGSQNEDIAVECMKAGATDYIIKEYRKRLGAAIINALEQKQAKDEKRRMEQLVVESEKKYKAIFENIQDVYYETSLDGTILEVSPSINNISHYTREELLGTSMYNYYPNPSERDKFIETLKTIGYVSDHEVILKDKDGSVIDCSITARIVTEPNSPTPKLIGMMRDISERLEFTRQLIVAKENAEEMNRLKSYFLANMSHELRTPLSGILGFSEILKNACLEPEAHEMIKMIHTSGTRLLNTLNQILDLSRIEANKQQIKLEIVDGKNTIHNAVTLFEHLAKAKGLKLNWRTELNDITLITDEHMLTHILNNLIDNAIRFTDEGGIKVTADYENPETGDYVIIKVEDTGIGISEDAMELIFEPFRQVSEGYSRTFEGTGLGLTLVKKYVELLNGEISVQSTIGVGTTFKIKLHVAGKKEIQAVEKKAETTNQYRIEKKQETDLMPNILLVDDDEMTHMIIKHILADKAQLDYANNGDSALSMLMDKKYDIVLLDINLKQKVSGLDILKLMRNNPKYHKTPVVAVTAYAMIGDKESFLAKGCSHYLSKPFSSADLLDVLDEIKAHM